MTATALATPPAPSSHTISLEVGDVELVADRDAAAPPIPRRRRDRPATLNPGMKIGAWRVDGELGRGGMGSVYAVTHGGFGKRAALKLCHKQMLDGRFTADTFLREARIVHLVDHPGACDVFATGTYDGRPYLAMERLTGRTLGQLLDRGPIARADAFDLLIELCDVLGAAHAAGVVHRDLKLDNVFVLDAPGAGGRRTKLLDWGVARILGEADPMRGMIAGTLTYIAPEQVLGDDITPAADIYALAVLAYQLLLGKAPFASAGPLELLRKHLDAPPPAPATLWPKIPPALAALLTAMLSKDPAARPSIAEVRRVLIAARDAGRRPVGWFARQRVVGATLGVVAVIASALSLLSA